jgi:N-terminal acetyltransferase B complex non-catalytic subunit
MTVPGLRDTLLLSHLYKLWLEAARRSRTSQEQPMTMNTAGQKFQQAWQSVTKAVKSKAEQEDLWLAFFNVALEEDCWEDVRFVSLSLHVNKFVVRDKKQSHFALLLATQLAAEQKSAIGGEEQMSQLQYSVALQKMKQAYEAPPVGSPNSGIRLLVSARS